MHVVEETAKDGASAQSSNTKNMDSASKPEDPSPTPPTDQPNYISGARLFGVTGAVTLVVFLMLLDMSIISTAIPKITTEFHSLGDIGWYGSAYNLAAAALQPLTGKIYTHFKAKWTFISFLLLFAVGSLICGVATSSNMLIGGRAIAGLGVSGLQNGGMTIVTNSVPFEKRAALLGILIGCGQLGIVLGPLLGGAITQYSTWRWCFYLNLPAVAVVTLILVLIRIPERPVKVNQSHIKVIRSELDLSGFVLFTPAAIMFLLGLEFGGKEHPWNSATVIGLLVGSGGAFAVFFAWEYRQGDRAMIPFSMLRKREVWTSMLVGTFIMGTIFVFSFYLPIYFQAVKGVSPFTSGVYVLPSILASTFFAVFSGVLVNKTRYYIPWVLFGGSMASIASGLFTTLSPSTTTAQWAGYQILLGARGAALQMPFVAMQSVLTQDQIPVSNALLVFSQTFGGAIFLTISQTIFSNSLSAELSSYLPPTTVAAIIQAGARGVRDVVSGDELTVALQAYCDSVSRVFYLSLAVSIGIFTAGWGMGWHDLTKKKEVISAAQTDEENQG